MYQAFGLFFGAFINANIFGELALIFDQLDKEDREFEIQRSFINTSMLNLNLKSGLKY